MLFRRRVGRSYGFIRTSNKKLLNFRPRSYLIKNIIETSTRLVTDRQSSFPLVEFNALKIIPLESVL